MLKQKMNLKFTKKGEIYTIFNQHHDIVFLGNADEMVKKFVDTLEELDAKYEDDVAFAQYSDVSGGKFS